MRARVRGGVLELVDQFAKASKTGNTFSLGWRQACPIRNQFIDALLRCRVHLIATKRVKQDYVIDVDPKTGRTVPRKVGLAPVQRDGLEYEFDIVGDLNLEHNLVVTKTRCRALDELVIAKPGRELADSIHNWLSAGVAPTTESRPKTGLETNPAQKQPSQVRVL